MNPTDNNALRHHDQAAIYDVKSALSRGIGNGTGDVGFNDVDSHDHPSIKEARFDLLAHTNSEPGAKYTCDCADLAEQKAAPGASSSSTLLSRES